MINYNTLWEVGHSQSIVFVMAMLSNIVIYAITDKSILDLFFKGEKGYVVNDMLDRDGQSIKKPVMNTKLTISI